MKIKRLVLIAVTVITLLAASVICCACGNDGNNEGKNEVKPPEPNYYTVEFAVFHFEGGRIEGQALQKVQEGGSTEKITAIADDGYYFAGWMDEGAHLTDETVRQAERIVHNVIEDVRCMAVFKLITCTVTYESDKNGYIDGDCVQSVTYGEPCKSVTAVPNIGYMFKEWSDGVKTATRSESELRENKTLTAIFETLQNTYTYDYKFADGNCEDKEATLTYGQLNSARLAVPMREHARFDGWYSDKYLTEKVSDKDGNVLVDDSFLYTAADTLYSKWISENNHPYKILIVYVTEIKAQLTRRSEDGKEYVHYVMSETERKICHMITEKLAFELNDLAIADFTVDEYFTTVPLGEDSIWEFKYPSGGICNEIFPYHIAEAKDKYSDYDSVLTSFSFNDYKNEFHRDGGTGEAKYGCVHFEESVAQALLDKWTFDDITNPDFIGWGRILNCYFHELAHTIEQRVNGFFDYHTVVSKCWDYRRGSFYPTQLYFLNKAIIDGKAVGIPYEFWEGKVARVFYEAKEGGMVYKGLAILNSEVRYEDEIQYVMYGQDALSVKAIAKYGYEFVGWSDGITTIERQDKNVTGDIYIFAIFKPINSE